MRGTKKPKILVVSDAVAPTGFSRVSENILRRLHEKYAFYQLGINFHGQPHRYPWKIYPTEPKRDVFGFRKIESLIQRLHPEIVFLINDIWVLKQYETMIAPYQDKLKTIVYLPIDSDPVEPELVESLLPIVTRWVTYTHFAVSELKSAMLSVQGLNGLSKLPEIEIIPHGVEAQSFYPLSDAPPQANQPRDRRVARRRVFAQRDDLLDAFIVFNGNRNQTRKRIDITIEGFSIFARGKPKNVKLYLHMAREDAGWDIQILARRFGIADRILLTTQENFLPNLDNNKLNLIYNACDVGLNTAQAEGWGLVSFEHAATGTAQVVPRHTTQEEIWQNAAAFVDPAFIVITEKVLTNAYYVAPEEVARILESLYRDPGYRRSLEDVALKLATEPCYSWDTIARRWDKIFQETLAS